MRLTLHRMNELQQPTQPTPFQVTRRDTRSVANRVTGRLKQCLDLMVWHGLKDNEAAVRVGFNVTSIRMALQRPHVRSYYLKQIEVLRDRERAQNIIRLTQIRDAADNMPAVNAIKALEQLGEHQQLGSTQQTPGITIVIQGDVKANTLDQSVNRPLVIEGESE